MDTKPDASVAIPQAFIDAIASVSSTIEIDHSRTLRCGSNGEVMFVWHYLTATFCTTLVPIGPRPPVAEQAFLANTWIYSPLQFRDQSMDWRLIDGWLPKTDYPVRSGTAHDIVGPIVLAAAAALADRR